MLVVADASPINVLVRVGRIEILGEIFKVVVAPPAVVAELTAAATPRAVREWMKAFPP